ncbi:HSP20 family molecular chaperone IbpA [Roseimicrobium gellanilyticum]|uniref:HSP20 family molecular chaperone IbpA n=1 Tax=Roseimicrobium gellanilyticum TaxID=748857 RepID=A0A366H179_9BACT|nr:Hsp20/alpha crystallin family protein [Roseimicrobium gellanilyticum]RBP35642.1 HSP20 family molecular chaperone IbpA [Roseimicrobium gellanilyticum]
MNSKTSSIYRRHVAARTLALVLAFALTTVSAFGAESSKEGPGGIAEHLKKWQEKISDTFRDAVKGLDKAGTQNKPAGSVSADFREQNDSYMLRLDLPHRTLDKVEVNLTGETLRVTAPEEGGTQRYEQTITLKDVSANAIPVVERKQGQNMLVVTIPKTPVKAELSAASSKGLLTPPLYLARDTEIMQRMEQMRRDMDRAFEDSFNAFKFIPTYKDIFDEYRFGSTYNVEDKGDSYEVRIFLPDRGMENVIATVEGQTLQIEARSESSPAGQQSNDGGVHRAAYTQRITLPGPVDRAKMKVEKKERMMVVMLPKATTH